LSREARDQSAKIRLEKEHVPFGHQQGDVSEHVMGLADVFEHVGKHDTIRPSDCVPGTEIPGFDLEAFGSGDE
jgi:hypothetical protein